MVPIHKYLQSEESRAMITKSVALPTETSFLSMQEES
jgi:hypothetical protein